MGQSAEPLESRVKTFGFDSRAAYLLAPHCDVALLRLVAGSGGAGT